jgi:hypothetical protein
VLGFFVLFIWLWLLIVCFPTSFATAILEGGRALWVIFVIKLPFLGVFVYLTARGGKMHERPQRKQRKAEDL